MRLFIENAAITWEITHPRCYRCLRITVSWISLVSRRYFPINLWGYNITKHQIASVPRAPSDVTAEDGVVTSAVQYWHWSEWEGSGCIGQMWTGAAAWGGVMMMRGWKQGVCGRDSVNKTQYSHTAQWLQNNFIYATHSTYPHWWGGPEIGRWISKTKKCIKWFCKNNKKMLFWAQSKRFK